MLNHHLITAELARNEGVFQKLLAGKSPETYHWRPAPEKWSLLEIVCHLYDEEREDFRARVRHVLETPELPLPRFNPIAWVTERHYAAQDYEEMLARFLAERRNSVAWLESLVSPNWATAYEHPTLGPQTAGMFLVNWLAHDYLHIRQVNRYLFEILKQVTGEDLGYAGVW